MKAISNTTLRMGLVTIPMQVCQGVETANDVTFKQAGPNGESLRQAYLLPDSTECPRDDMQKGIFQGGDFFPVSKSDLNAIAEATKRPDLEVLEVIDAEDFWSEAHRITDLYYLQSPAKGGNPNAFKLFVDALESASQVIVTKWTARSRQKLLVLWPKNGLLMGSGLAFEGDVREPDEHTRAHLAGAYSQQEAEMAQQLLGMYHKDKPTALSMEVDEAVAMKHKLVDDALAGLGVDVPKDTTPQPAKNAALADALSATLAAMAPKVAA